MAASIGLLDFRIMIFRLLRLSDSTSHFDRVCGGLHLFMRACTTDALAFNVAVSFKLQLNLCKTATLKKSKNWFSRSIIA